MRTFDKWLLRIAVGGITLAAFSIAVAVILVSAHIGALLGNTGKSAATVASVIESANGTLQIINRPCGNGRPCGTLAEISKATVKVGDILVTSQRQEQDTARAAQRTMASVDGVAAHINTLADSLAGTASAATGTLSAATDTLVEGKRTIAAAQPALAAYTQSGNDLDALIRDNATPLHTTLVHVSGMSDSGDKMLADAQWKAHQLLHPDKVKLGFWAAMWAGVKAIHEIEPPIF